MRVMVTGSNGQLGHDVVRVLEEKKINYIGVDIEQLDITNEREVSKFIKEYKPTVVIHCAAYTAVDKAEENRHDCYDINVMGTRYLVRAAKKIGADLVYISTDYVFDGTGDKPFNIESKPNPVNYYGKTKYEGELEVISEISNYFIIRISWAFGLNGNNFVKTMLRLSESNNEISVVSDQIGSPTYTYDLAYAIYDLIYSKSYGVHHITNEGFCSWNEFAQKIFQLANKQVIIKEIKSVDYNSAAKRPNNSRLEKNQIRLREWEKALQHFLEEYYNDK